MHWACYAHKGTKQCLKIVKQVDVLLLLKPSTGINNVPMLLSAMLCTELTNNVISIL